MRLRNPGNTEKNKIEIIINVEMVRNIVSLFPKYIETPAIRIEKQVNRK